MSQQSFQKQTAGLTTMSAEITSKAADLETLYSPGTAGRDLYPSRPASRVQNARSVAVCNLKAGHSEACHKSRASTDHEGSVGVKGPREAAGR